MTLRCHCLQTEKRIENSTGIKVAKWHITSAFKGRGIKPRAPDASVGCKKLKAILKEGVQ